MKFRVILGDCAEVLRTLPDASVHAVVTDPPAGIGFMGSEWDHDKGGRDAWVAWLEGIARECLRVIKPGGHALVWALPRTSHWTATAWESAGWEVRDRLAHLFGVGFPKSLDVSKAIDAAAGAERNVVGSKAGTPGYSEAPGRGRNTLTSAADGSLNDSIRECQITAPATPEAAAWDGWGTALKPGMEDWWLLRKPLRGTVAANVLEHGTGALNINGCRIAVESEGRPQIEKKIGQPDVDDALYGAGLSPRSRLAGTTTEGRWPANVLHDGSPEVLDEFAKYGESEDGVAGKRNGVGMIATTGLGPGYEPWGTCGGAGTPARFFYCTKATTSDREDGLAGMPLKSGGELTGREDGTDGLKSPRAGAGRGGKRANMHPTVKPTGLMRWLCRLVTPPGGTVLDPFCGSGSTGRGALIEGFDFIGIEREAEFVELARLRIMAAGGLFAEEVAS